MSNYELKKKLVRDMDEYVRNISDENAWLWWIEDGVPDGATDDDYDWFAEQENEDDWCALCALFGKIVNCYN